MITTFHDVPKLLWVFITVIFIDHQYTFGAERKKKMTFMSRQLCKEQHLVISFKIIEHLVFLWDRMLEIVRRRYYKFDWTEDLEEIECFPGVKISQMNCEKQRQQNLR